MFVKYNELQLVSEAICCVWLSYFFCLAGTLSLSIAPALKDLCYELGVRSVLFILQDLGAVRSVKLLK